MKRYSKYKNRLEQVITEQDHFFLETKCKAYLDRRTSIVYLTDMFYRSSDICKIFCKNTLTVPISITIVKFFLKIHLCFAFDAIFFEDSQIQNKAIVEDDSVLNPDVKLLFIISIKCSTICFLFY